MSAPGEAARGDGAAGLEVAARRSARVRAAGQIDSSRARALVSRLVIRVALETHGPGRACAAMRTDGSSTWPTDTVTPSTRDVLATCRARVRPEGCHSSSSGSLMCALWLPRFRGGTGRPLPVRYRLGLGPVLIAPPHRLTGVEERLACPRFSSVGWPGPSLPTLAVRTSKWNAAFLFDDEA